MMNNAGIVSRAGYLSTASFGPANIEVFVAC